MIKFVVEFMDDVADTIEEIVTFFYQYFIKLIMICIVKAILIMSYPLWIIPYKIFRKKGKNQKSAEAYASKGEAEC